MEMGCDCVEQVGPPPVSPAAARADSRGPPQRSRELEGVLPVSVPPAARRRVRDKPLKLPGLADRLRAAKEAAEKPFEVRMPGEPSGGATSAPAPAPAGGLLEQMATIVPPAPGEGSAAADAVPEVVVPGLGAGTAAAAPGLIEELGQPPASDGGFAQRLRGGMSAPRVPDASATLLDGGAVVVRVELPGLGSVAQCELDVAEHELTLQAPGFASLTLSLPARVLPDGAAAKFKKKQQALVVSIPAAPA